MPVTMLVHFWPSVETKMVPLAPTATTRLVVAQMPKSELVVGECAGIRQFNPSGEYRSITPFWPTATTLLPSLATALRLVVVLEVTAR